MTPLTVGEGDLQLLQGKCTRIFPSSPRQRPLKAAQEDKNTQSSPVADPSDKPGSHIPKLLRVKK